MSLPGVSSSPGVSSVAGVVAVRAGEVVAAAGGGAAVVGSPVVSGELLSWCVPVVTAPAVVGRDGGVRVAGWLADQVRLGLLERHVGEGVIEQVVAADGQARPAQRRRVMSLELTLRAVVAMAVMPDASYREALARLVGQLPALPWARPWAVPSSRVVTDWRRRLGEGPAKALFWRVAGPIVDGPAARWLGLELCAIDGFQTRVPDTPPNRAAFASSGTSDNTAPFPQVRVVMATARAGRAVLGAALDASSVGEQTLTRRLVADHPQLFGPGRVFLVDANFLGRQLITDIRAAGAHLIMRIKAGVTLRLIRWLPDGSYLGWLGVKDPIQVRVVEYNVELPDATGAVSELFCLATTLTDWETYPATEICAAYPQRWSAAETTIGENKSTITDAGPSRGPILRSQEPALVRQELWAWLTGTQLLRKAAHATTQHAPTPVDTDQISFTATRHQATRSMTQTLVTATTTPQALAAAAHRAALTILTHLNTTHRDRHSPRLRKHQPRFPHTTTTKPTTHGPATITLFAPTPPNTS